MIWFWFFLQFTVHAQATQTAPAVAPPPLLSPAQPCWKLLLLLLPARPKAPPAKPDRHQPNRSAAALVSDRGVFSHPDVCFCSQIFQGNRRTFQGQGYHSGGPRYNGGSYHDRNAGRANHRYHGDPSQHSNTSRGPFHSSSSSQDRPAHNGLPQRAPRTHCP